MKSIKAAPRKWLITGLLFTFLLIASRFPAWAQELPYLSPFFDFLQDPGSEENEEDSSAYLIVKYREELLKDLSEEEQEQEAQTRIEKIVGRKGKVQSAVKLQAKSAKEQTEKNKQKFPERAKRIPEGAGVPNLGLLKRVEVDESEAEEVVNLFRQNPEIEYAEIEEEPRPTNVDTGLNKPPSLPNDSYYLTTRGSSDSVRDSWAQRKINLNPIKDDNSDSGWDKTQGSREIVVAAYGTGLDYFHPDLMKNVWVNPGEDLDNDEEVWDEDDINGVDDDQNGYIDDLVGWNFGGNNNDPYDDGQWWSGHDTMVASIMGAVGNNGIGVVGINWRVRMMAILSGGYAQMIIYAVDNGADVVNISWTGYGSGLKDIVDYAYANGTIVVFSAANNGIKIPYTASISDRTWIISATTYDDTKASWSNWGDRIDFSAPGYTVLSAIPTGRKGSGFFTYYPLLALAKDRRDRIAIAYFDPENNALKFGEKKNGGWKFETVEKGQWAGLYVSLDFDKRNQPHLAYYDWDDRQLKYATKRNGTGLTDFGTSWKIKTLTNVDDQGYFTSLKIGADGRLRIAYIDRTHKLLKLMTLNESGQEVEEVASIGSFSIYQSAVSLALDSDNRPYISFWKGDSQDLAYAKKEGDTWVVETPDTAGNTGGFSSLVLDQNGYPHIAYTDITNWDLKYAFWDGSSWQVQTLLSEGYQGYFSDSIALDKEGHPHLTTISIVGGNFYLYYTFYNGSEWITERIGPTESLGFNQKIALNEKQWLFFVSASQKGSFYEGTRLGDEAWQVNWITDWGNPYSSLGGTSAAAPMVSGLAALTMAAHPDWNLDQIYWAVAQGAFDPQGDDHHPYFGWGRIDADATLDIEEPLTDETPPEAVISYPENGDVVEPGIIEITGTANDENFTYYNLLFRRVGYTYWANAVSWYNHTPQEDGILGTWDASGWAEGDYELRLEVHDWYHISTHEIQFHLGVPVTPTPTSTPTPTATLTPTPSPSPTPTPTPPPAPGNWNITTVVDGWEYHPSVTTDAANNYLIAHQDGDNGFLMFSKSTDEGTTWSTSTVDNNSWTGDALSMTTDAANNYLIAYQYSNTKDLKFAKSIDGGTSWAISTVQSTGDVGYHVSMATDNDDNYLIAYNFNNYYLWLAKSADGGTTWTKVNIDGGPSSVGRFNSLTVDLANNYLISYWDMTNKNLKFAKSSDGGNTWTVTVVDSPGDVGYYTSIAVDSTGNYLISYFDNDNDDLKLAKSTDGGVTWTISIVDSGGNVGQGSVVAVDPTNNYLIAYADSVSDDMRFAKSTDNGQSWSLEIVDTDNAESYVNSITVDALNNYLLTYTGGANEDLKLAKQPSGF